MHPATEALLAYFSYDHLPSWLAAISKPFCELAHTVAAHPHLEGAEVTVCLRKLLEAKDCAVRAALPAPAGPSTPLHGTPTPGEAPERS